MIVRDFSSYPSVLTVLDVKEILGIGRGQAYDLVNSGAFHVVKVNSRILISKDVFCNWINGT
jgi:hypothetical protein